MSMNTRSFDRLWYAIAIASVSSVLLVSHFSALLGPWGYILLATPLASASFIALFVTRDVEAHASETVVANGDQDESTKVETLEAVEETRPWNLELVYASTQVHSHQTSIYKALDNNFDQALEGSIRNKSLEQGILERLLFNEKAITSRVERAMTTRLEQRRNVLREARELALQMRGTNLAIHVSQDSEISICERERSVGWQVVADPEPLPSDRTGSPSAYVN